MTLAIGVDGEEFEFGDADPEDAIAAGDDQISWDHVEELADKYAAVEAIGDTKERLAAAVSLTEELVPSVDVRRFGASVDKNLWLHSFPSEAAKRGLVVQTYPGWELRSRSSGGFDDILGVCLHHTASRTSPANDMNFQWVQTGNFQPIGNFSLHRDGNIVLGAAGAANTQGTGGPYQCSKGYVPTDAGNRYMIAIEACNNGTGEVWPNAQIRAYERLIEVLCDVYGLNPNPDVLLHATWTDRKIDPAGPTPLIPAWGGTSGARTWNLAEVRKSVLDSSGGGGIPDMSEFKITNPVRIVDTRSGTGHNNIRTQLSPGQSITVAPHGYTPDDADGVILSITGISHSGPGHLTFWSGEGPVPTSSSVNPAPGVVANNMAWVPLYNGTFKVAAGGNSSTKLGVVIEQVGHFYT